MTEGPQWTPEQKAGIETTGVNLLVSAAAGSGKTAVLSERCAYLVCDADPPCDVDQLLVVTFTEAAAAEMKNRIESALRKHLDQNPEDHRLTAQIAQIDRAQVGTLHGFCSRVLRQHFHLLELDPNFTILNADEAKLLRLEVVRELFAQAYETDESGIFQNFIDVYGDGNDDDLQENIIHTHELLCSVIDPEAWISEARARIIEGAAQPLRDCALGQELAAIIRRRLASLTDRAATAIAAVSRMDGFGKYVDYLRRLSDTLAEWSSAFGDGNFNALARAVTEFDPGRMPTIKNDAPGKTAAVAAVDSVREDMGKEGALFSFIRFSEQEWSDGLKSIAPSTEVFLDLVQEFRRRYTVAKERARGIDFADLERLTLKVLRSLEDGRWIASPIALALQRQIAHVLVDEYQDINGVQEAILALVNRENPPHHNPLPRSTEREGMKPNLFCVGDVKQSIYGFRLAEPGRFLERYDRFKSNAASGRVIDLQANFRSRAPLLEALNGLFERLMTKEAADIDYDDSQKLKPGATFPPAGDVPGFTGAPIELHLLPRHVESSDDGEEAAAELDRTEREASFIAARIHQLMGHDGSPPMHVADRSPDGTPILRPIARRDIVIILRSMVYKADQIANVLRLHGIPVHRDSGTGYFNSTEIRDMLALLQLLDNGQQDIPLVTVLRSPLGRLPAAEDSLARIRLAYRDANEPLPFHQAVTRYAKEQTDELAARLRDFLAELGRWREMSRLRPLADLIWRIYDDTGYLSFCSGLDNGEQRCANLLHLHERAKQFGSFSRQGLYRFLRFLKGLQTDSDMGQPSVLGPGEDVVRIMTVHKSKGLEFPVVFLPDLGKRINLRDSTGRVLVDRARYLGLVAVDEAKQVRYPSLASVLVSERLRQQSMAEELRVLYVATTRAKEHLILVGTCDAKSQERWQTLYGSHRGPLPAEVVLSAGNMLDWIVPAAAAMAGSGLNAFAITVHSSEEINDWSLAASAKSELTPRQIQCAALKPLDPAPPRDELALAVIERLAFAYPHEKFSHLRAAMPVTEWAKKDGGKPSRSMGYQPMSSIQEHGLVAHATNSSPSTVPFPLPRSIAGEMAIGAADKGTATHLVLEHLDFTRPCHAMDLEIQIQRMLDLKLIAPAQADSVDRGAIEWFAACETGQQIRHSPAENVLREIPFNLALPPQDFLGVPDSNQGLDQVMLRGRIDLLLRQGNSVAVIDYKTDNISADQIEGRKEMYQPQVLLYRDAIEKLTGLRVAGVYLIFLTPRIVCGM